LGNAWQQSLKGFALEPDASCGRSKSIPGKVDEHGAPAPGDAGPGVVIDLDDDVVKAVGTAQSVAWFSGRPPEVPVVAAVCRILTPGVGRPDPANRQQSVRPKQAVGAPPHPDRVKSASRGPSIAFALVSPDTAAAQRDRENQRACEQPAQRWPARPRADTNGAE
jgi:hypothetical protein